MKKIIACIVLFNKKLEESKSFNTLQKTAKGLVDEIIIYNNGPKPISINKESVVVNNILINASLSKIYNHFIMNNEAEIFLILDDDSSLNFEFLNELKKSNNIISSPKITCNGKKVYPIFTKHETQTISSGMAISNEYKKKMFR